MGFFCCLMLYFQYIRKLYHWMLWKSCMQLLYLIFKVLYKLLHIIFTAIHLQWIRKISTSKRAVYITSRRFMSLYLFCMWCLTCVYNIQTVYECLSLLYVVSYFFAQSSFDSSSPYTAQQRVN